MNVVAHPHGSINSQTVRFRRADDGITKKMKVFTAGKYSLTIICLLNNVLRLTSDDHERKTEHDALFFEIVKRLR